MFFTMPEGSPYEGGRFQLHFSLENYPRSAPSVTMKTRCYNPYISHDGRICCSILVCFFMVHFTYSPSFEWNCQLVHLLFFFAGIQSSWTPLTNLSMIVTAIIQLFSMFKEDGSFASDVDEGNNPLEAEIYAEYMRNPELFRKKAREMTQKYAMMKHSADTSKDSESEVTAMKRPHEDRGPESELSDSKRRKTD